jgi:hypothetical protein
MFMTLSDQLRRAPKFSIEVLTAAELDIVVGGGPFNGDDSLDCSCTVSQCSSDGNNEPGTS